MLSYLKRAIRGHMLCGPEAVMISQIVGGAVSVAGFLGQQDARDEQRQANEQMAAERRTQYANEQRRAEIQNVRAARQQIRQQRMAAASIVGRGATTGTLGSSGVQGGVSSTGAQLAGNLSYMSDIADVNTAQGESSQRFASAEQQAGQAAGDYQMWGAVGSLGGTIFARSGGWESVFGGNKGTPENAGKPK